MKAVIRTENGQVKGTAPKAAKVTTYWMERAKKAEAKVVALEALVDALRCRGAA